MILVCLQEMRRRLHSCERKLQKARSQLEAAGISPWSKCSHAPDSEGSAHLSVRLDVSKEDRAALQAMQKKLQAREKEFGEELAAKDMELVKLMERVARADNRASKKLDAKEAELQELRALIASQEAQADDVETVMGKSLLQLKEKLKTAEEDAKATVIAKEAEIAAKDEQIVALKEQIAFQANELKAKSKDSELDQLRTQLTAAQAQLAGKSQEVEQIRAECRSPHPDLVSALCGTQNSPGSEGSLSKEAALSQLRELTLQEEVAGMNAQIEGLQEQLSAQQALTEEAKDRVAAQEHELEAQVQVTRVVSAELERVQEELQSREVCRDAEMCRVQDESSSQSPQYALSPLGPSVEELASIKEELELKKQELARVEEMLQQERADAESRINTVLTEAAQALHESLAQQAAEQAEFNHQKDAVIAALESELEITNIDEGSPLRAIRSQLDAKEAEAAQLREQLEVVWKDAARALHDEVKQVQEKHQSELKEVQAAAEERIESEKREFQRQYDEVFEAAEQDVRDVQEKAVLTYVYTGHPCTCLPSALC